MDDDREQFSDNLERQETTRRDWDQGCCGLAGQDTSSVRRSPFHLAMDRYILRYPQGRARAGEDERPTGTDYQETTEQQHTTTNLNSGNVCICGKVCKNQRGLKIHMGKMGCSPIQS